MILFTKCSSVLYSRLQSCTSFLEHSLPFPFLSILVNKNTDDTIEIESLSQMCDINVGRKISPYRYQSHCMRIKNKYFSTLIYSCAILYSFEKIFDNVIIMK